MDFVAPPLLGPKGKNKRISSSLRLAVLDEATIFLGATKDSRVTMVHLDPITREPGKVERHAAILMPVSKAYEEAVEL
eukprot:3602524-Pyramimonas_sp.AAC.1